jgi:hypothetical protein
MYTIVPIGSDFEYDVQLNPSQLDTDGNPLVHGASYQAVVYSPASKAFSESAKIVLAINAVYQGKYRGTWSDNLFSAIPISCILQGDGDAYVGSVYISSNFEPTFGAVSNNGSTSFEMDNGQISSFVYFQHAPDYKGGCPGKYTGSGTANDAFTLSINFIGDDCDGHHTNGFMKFSRVWRE